MEFERDVLVSPTTEVPVIEGQVVTAIRTLAGRGVGKKAIAREVGVAVNTVRRYLRQPIAPGMQVRPAARRLTDDRRRGGPDALRGAGGWQCGRGAAAARRARLRDERPDDRARGRRHSTRAARGGAGDRAGGNGAGRPAADRLWPEAAADLPGVRVRIFLLVAVLSYSRRLFVKAFLNERGDDWREGIAAAFAHFGGVPRTLLGDNARALGARPRPRDRHGESSIRPISRSVATGTCSRARAPRIARGPKARPKRASNTSSAMRWRIRRFESLRARSSSTWPRGWRLADQRRHGTTREAPIVRFERDERAALRPLPLRALPRRTQRLRRRVALDAFVDVDTVRYSVPHRLVRDHVEVVVEDQRVRIFHGAPAGRDARPIDRAVCPRGRCGPLRRAVALGAGRRRRHPALALLGRDLADYAAVVDGGQ